MFDQKTKDTFDKKRKTVYRKFRNLCVEFRLKAFVSFTDVERKIYYYKTHDDYQSSMIKFNIILFLFLANFRK